VPGFMVDPERLVSPWLQRAVAIPAFGWRLRVELGYIQSLRFNR